MTLTVILLSFIFIYFPFFVLFCSIWKVRGTFCCCCSKQGDTCFRIFWLERRKHEERCSFIRSFVSWVDRQENICWRFLTFFWQHEEALCFLQLNKKRMEKGKKHIFLSEWILITFFCPKVVHFLSKSKTIILLGNKYNFMFIFSFWEELNFDLAY